MNSSFRDGKQFAWDSTSLTEAMTCKRKYYYSIVRGLRTKQTSVHLFFGGLYASALEHFYKHLAEGKDREEALFLVVREAMLESWDNEANAPFTFPDSAKTRFALIRSIVWYTEEFASDIMPTFHLSNGKPAVELSFSFEVDDDLLLCGHLDRVVDYQGSLFVMDQKTTGATLSPHFFSSFDLSNQMTLYTLAGQIILNNPIRGVIIDGAQIAVGFTHFLRGFTYRTAEQLAEWIKGTKVLIKEVHEAADAEFYPMNTTACGNYSGCQFKEICTASPRVREAIISSSFNTRVWDPLERR